MISVVRAQCVVAVAQLGSFREAAAALHMTQPAVSANVERAERSLDVVLFERDPVGAHLTASGATLLPHFEALLASHASVIQQSAQINSGDETVLRIASHRFGQLVVLPSAVHATRQALGPLLVDVTHATEERAVQLVKSGGAEIGVGFRSPGAPAADLGLEEVVIDTIPIVIYCRSDHAFASRAEVSLDEVAAETIVSIRKAAWERVFRGRPGMESASTSRVTVDDSQVALHMVAEGVGVAALAKGLESIAPDDVVSVPLAGGPMMSLTVFRRSGCCLSEAGEVLWRELIG